jgi:hypothetical protein
MLFPTANREGVKRVCTLWADPFGEFQSRAFLPFGPGEVRFCFSLTPLENFKMILLLGTFFQLD